MKTTTIPAIVLKRAAAKASGWPHACPSPGASITPADNTDAWYGGTDRAGDFRAVVWGLLAGMVISLILITIIRFTC